MGGKRPIDLLRDSGGSLEIGAPDDPIVGLLEIDGCLHAIKEEAIYLMKLADQVDPGRTNPNIPNIHQLVLGYGANHEIVARTL